MHSDTFLVIYSITHLFSRFFFHTLQHGLRLKHKGLLDQFDLLPEEELDEDVLLELLKTTSSGLILIKYFTSQIIHVKTTAQKHTHLYTYSP